MGGTFAEKSSSPFKLRHQLSPQQLQSCQKSSKDRQKMLWIDLKTTLDVRFIAFSVANSNVLMCPFFLQFYHYLPSLASKTMLVSPEPEITGRVTVLPIVPNLEERPLVRVRRDLESAVYVSPILRFYFNFSREIGEIYVIPLWTVNYHLFVDEFWAKSITSFWRGFDYKLLLLMMLAAVVVVIERSISKAQKLSLFNLPHWEDVPIWYEVLHQQPRVCNCKESSFWIGYLQKGKVSREQHSK